MARRAKPLLVAAIVLGLLALPGLGHLLRLDDGLRTLEMRAPVAAPAWPASLEDWRALPRRLDAYLADAFGFRRELIAAQNALRYELGAARAPSVLAGKGDWLFFTGDREHEQYLGTDRFTPAALEAWVAAMEARRAWLAARGIPLVVLIPPNKHTIYPEMLPDWVAKRQGSTRLDQVMARVAGTKLEVIDLRADLLAAKAAAPVFFRQDSHWTSAGAFAGYRRLADWIAARHPAFRPLRAEDLAARDLARPRPGEDLDLARMLGILGRVPEPDRLLLPQGRMRDRDALMRSGAAHDVFTSDAPGPSVLLFRDSFGLEMLPFLAESLPRLIVAEHRRGGFDAALVEETRPDLVVYEIVERLLMSELINPPGWPPVWPGMPAVQSSAPRPRAP